MLSSVRVCHDPFVRGESGGLSSPRREDARLPAGCDLNNLAMDLKNPPFLRAERIDEPSERLPPEKVRLSDWRRCDAA